jgi:hypothetical protein
MTATEPHAVVIISGTCFLVGGPIDPEDDIFSPGTNNSEKDSFSSAGIELICHKHETLHAKITYSSMYCFHLDFDDDMCRSIVYDTTTEDEKAKISLCGSTEFFELQCVVIKNKSLIAMLKSFTNRRLLLQKLSKQQIAPGTFYSTGKGVSVSSSSSVFFKTFSRQDLAFQYFDDKTKDHQFSRYNPVKLFSFESLMAGKRQFLVADMKSFMTRYLNLEGSKRHVYELIREDFPCRLYFDLEFSIPANPDTDGNHFIY